VYEPTVSLSYLELYKLELKDDAGELPASDKNRFVPWMAV